MITRRSASKWAARAVLAASIAIGVGSVSDTAWAEGKSLSEATKEEKAEAQKLYVQAKKDFDAKRYEEALAGFRASYEVVASPNSHHMIVRSLDAQERHLEAWEEAQVTVAEAEAAAAGDRKYQKTAQAARTKRDELRSKIAMVTVNVGEVSDEADLTVAGRSIDRSQWGEPIAVMPGEVAIVLNDDGDVRTRDLDLEPGASSTVSMAPGTDPDGEPTNGDNGSKSSSDDGSPALRITSYVLGGVGVAGFIMFGVAGGLHLSQYSELRDRCRAGVCPAGVQADIDRGQTYQTLANVGLGIGAVGVGVGAILFIASQPDVRFEGKESSGTTSVAIGPGSVTLKGTF